MSKKRRSRPKAAAAQAQPGRTAAAGTLAGPKRRWLVLAVGLVVAAAGALGWMMVRRSRGAGGLRLPPPVATRGDTVRYADFVGAEECAECHRAQYAAWKRSTHGRAGGPPAPERVIAPFDGRPFRFQDAVVTPSVTAQGEYRFTVAQEGRAEVVFHVAGVVGGGHLFGGGTQGFLTEFPDGTLRFLPFDWSRQERAWFCNTNGRTERGFARITPAMRLAECGDWTPGRGLGSQRYGACQQCHGSQIRLSFDPGAHRYRTQFTTLAVNCESCHGPGRRHADLARAGFPGGGTDIGLQALAALDKDASLMVCFRCHSLKQELRNDGYLPGDSLEEFFMLRMHVLEGSPFHNDGRVRHFAYQESHLYSDCYLNGSMQCTDCHDPHSQRYRDVNGAPLGDRFADGQCLGCHASKAEAPERHTHHRSGSPGSRCVACHMPYHQEPRMGRTIRYARSDHTISIPRPALDSALGLEGACRQCHRDRPVQALEAQARTWYGELKPQHPAVVALGPADSTPDRPAAASLLLGVGDSHRAAQVVGLARFVRRFLSPDMPELEPATVARLERLAPSRDPDVAGLALMSLHLARGNDPAVRRFLVRRVRELGPREALVRARWTWALLAVGNAYQERGAGPYALAVYRKAEEVSPGAPTVEASLGLALSGVREYAAAEARLRRSLAADPNQPVTLANLGYVQQQRGDVEGALATYRRAVELDPYEPYVYVSLGNAYARLSRIREAVEAWQRAVELDPRLASADVSLAAAYERGGDRARAVAALRRALEFEPRNATARQMLQRLE